MLAFSAVEAIVGPGELMGDKDNSSVEEPIIGDSLVLTALCTGVALNEGGEIE
jgi:hypothetical protein